MEMTSKELQLESVLKEMADMLHSKMGISGNFEDLDKSLKIIALKNKNHYPSIDKKMRNFTRILYEIGAFRDVNEDDYLTFINKLDEVDGLIKDIIDNG